MKLKPQRVRDYHDNGFTVLPALFSNTETNRLKEEVLQIAARNSAGRVFEKDGQTVRALHGCHLTSELLRAATRLPRLLEPVTQLLGGPVYVYQFKINFKEAFAGDVWQWHQDYIYWRNEDGMREPHVVNVAVFLDAVTEHNGPLMLVAGSHRHGLIEVEAAGPTEMNAEGWRQNVAADLTYTLDRATVATLVSRGNIVAPKGAAGTSLIFHPNLAHASGPNLSPASRTMMLVTYNSVANVPNAVSNPRPEFLVSRDCTPIVPLAQDRL